MKHKSDEDWQFEDYTTENMHRELAKENAKFWLRLLVAGVIGTLIALAAVYLT